MEERYQFLMETETVEFRVWSEKDMKFTTPDS
jgi:hypothetical protein